jgi:hypothetical protein
MLVRLLMLLGKDWRVVLVWQSCPTDLSVPQAGRVAGRTSIALGFQSCRRLKGFSVCLVGGFSLPTGMPLVPVECSSATVLTNRCTPRHNVYKGCTNTLAILIRKGNQVALVEAAAWKL